MSLHEVSETQQQQQQQKQDQFQIEKRHRRYDVIVPAILEISSSFVLQLYQSV